VTEGKFTEALKLFSQLLTTIPLVVVDTRKEVDDVKEVSSLFDSGERWGRGFGPRRRRAGDRSS
jgi:hypothetical protein